jgi:hypothetical protein
MGQKTIGGSRRVPTTQKSSVDLTREPDVPPPLGCPGQVTLEGADPGGMTVGDDAALTLAADRPQLVVRGRVVEITASDPHLDRIGRCLQQGEKYFGQVTSVSGGQFRAVLARA